MERLDNSVILHPALAKPKNQEPLRDRVEALLTWIDSHKPDEKPAIPLEALRRENLYD